MDSFKQKISRAAHSEWLCLAALLAIWLVGTRWVSTLAVLFTVVALAGGLMLLDRFVWAKRRSAEGRGTPAPAVAFARGLFPVLAVIFLIKACLVEQFVIPSSSMRPGLVVGDYILVNKLTYGLRVPLLNHVLVPVGAVQRNDVVVFSYPEDEKRTYIKRVIGVPGDVVSYQGKVLTVNSREAVRTAAGNYRYDEEGQPQVLAKIAETHGAVRYETLVAPARPTYHPQGVRKFAGHENCTYSATGFTCRVPAGHYFMMGDNRDNSEDSRYWGFVSERQVQGRAFMVWLNLSDFSRAGTSIR